jgi:hypothetical protein
MSDQSFSTESKLGAALTEYIPVGLGTKLGVGVGALAALLAIVTAILNGDHSEETVSAALVAAANFYAVIRGRMDQAAAAAAPR